MLADATLQTIVWTSRKTEAKEFYGSILELPFRGTSHGALVFGVGDGELRVSPVPTTEPSAHTVVGFAVRDVAALAALLASRGVQLERFPNLRHDEGGVWTAPDGTKVAWFRDPDRNLLSIVQYV